MGHGWRTFEREENYIGKCKCGQGQVFEILTRRENDYSMEIRENRELQVICPNGCKS